MKQTGFTERTGRQIRRCHDGKDTATTALPVVLDYCIGRRIVSAVAVETVFLTGYRSDVHAIPTPGHD